MYEDKEVFWFSQSCLNHFDKQYQSNSYLRISYSISTTDFWNFNIPNLGFSISENNKTRSYNLNLPDTTDLYKSLRNVITDPANVYGQGDFQIDKQYRHDQKLILKFQTIQSDDNVVTIFIYRSDSDFGRIIIPYNLFEVIVLIIKSFIENYDTIQGNLRRDCLLSKSLQINQKLAGDIKSLPNQLIETSKIEENSASKESSNNPENQMEELDKFLGKDMNNIPSSPELERLDKKEGKIQEFNSKFLDQIKNLYEFEKFLETAHVAQNPVMSVYNRLSNGGDVSLLPSISEKDSKSLAFISKLIYLSHLRSYTENGTGIPPSFMDLKYKVDKGNIQNENLELAYDLLLVMSYIKCFRNKVESRTNDAEINKSKMYLALRCFCDVFTFSFLKGIESSKLASTVISRFKYYDSLGFFDYYKGLLEDNNCEQVTEQELHNFIIRIGEVVGKTLFIDEMHEVMFKEKQTKLPSDNNFSTEQIINEIIPIEVDINVKKALDGNVVEGKSPEIKSLFKTKQDPNNTSDIQRPSNLVRLLKSFESEIDSKVKDEFWKYVENFKDKNFDFKNFSVDLNRLGEVIVKALYLWKPEDNSQLISNYTYFCDKVEKEIMGKKEIIISLQDESKPDGENWFSSFGV